MHVFVHLLIFHLQVFDDDFGEEEDEMLAMLDNIESTLFIFFHDTICTSH